MQLLYILIILPMHTDSPLTLEYSFYLMSLSKQMWQQNFITPPINICNINKSPCSSYYLMYWIIYAKYLLFKLFFGFDFLCYFIVIMFQNRIILIRFCILLIWFQSCCTQIVPNTYKTKIIYIKDYIGTPSKSSSIIC